MSQLSKLVLTLSLSIFFSSYAFTQNHYQKAWTAFNQNKLNEARRELHDAISQNQNVEKAYLTLSIINTIDKEDGSALDNFIEFATRSKNINPYLYAMWYDDNLLGSSQMLSKKRLSFLKQLMDNNKLNSTMVAKINFALGYNLQSREKFKASNEYFSKVGEIMQWQLAGNFENISGSGFNKKWKAINHPEADATFKNKYGAPVQWFQIADYLPGRWIHPGYQSHVSNSIMFAQTFVKSATDQDVQLRLGVSGSVKVWVNDKLMFSEEDERNNGIDAYVFTSHLKSGFNRILIQLGQSDDVTDMNYLLRITDNNGKLVEGLEARSSFRPYQKENSFQSKEIPSFCEHYFQKQLSSQPNNLLNLILMAKAYSSNDKNYKTRKTIKTAKKLAPKSSYIANLLMNVYIREDANTLLSLELEKVKHEDARNPLSLQLLYNEALDEKDYDKAAKIVDEIEDIYGKNIDVYTKRIELLGKKEEQKALISMIEEAYKKYPKNWGFVQYRYLVAVKVDNNYSYAISLLYSFVKHNYNTNAWKAIAKYYRAIGNTKKAISIYQKMEANQPYLPSYTNIIASTYASMGDYNKAILYYKKLITKAPYIGYYIGELAKAYKEKGDDATATFEKALLYNPTDFDLRKIYREYTHKKAVFDYFDEPDLYKMYKESKNAKDYPEDNSLIIDYETQKVVYHDGGSEEKIYLLIKVFNATGIDQWKEYNIGYQSADIEKAEVLKKDGNKLKAETNGSHIVYTNLEEGDAILLIYSIRLANSGKLLKQFWDDNFFAYQYPFNTIKYSLLVQDKLPFTYKMNHSELKPSIEEKDKEFTLYTWQEHNKASVKTEKYMQSFSDFAPELHLSTIPNWNWVNKWYYDISTTKAKSDYEVEDVTHKILKGKDSLSDKDKIHLIYDYVVNNIHYSSIPFRQNGIVPQKASRVINTKIGDCKDVSTLFIALCREAGYKANLLLVDTRNNGEQDLFLPSIGFNHAIAKVYVDSTFYIVELTSDLNAFSTMGRTLKKSFVLEINGTNSEPFLLDSKTRVPNAFKRTTTVTINGDNLAIKRSAIKYGDYASATRNSYRDIGNKKREKKMQRAISDDFAHTKLLSLHFDTTLYTTADSVVYNYDFTVDDAFTSFGNTQLIEMPFSIKQGPMDFINNPNRKYALAFWKYINDDYQLETLTFNIPKDLTLAEMPKDMHYSSAYADYNLTFHKTKNKLIAIRKIVFKKDIVPAKDFQNFANFYAKVIKADKTQIGFKSR